MKVVTTFHQPSSVTTSLQCSLTADDELGHLLVAKSNRIEVSAITTEGLKSQCSLEIWGRVLSMKAVPAKDMGASNVLVLLDHPHPRLLLLEYRNTGEEYSLDTTWSSDLHDRHSRHAEFFTDIVTTAFGEVAVVSCYAGKLRVLTFEKGKVSKDFDVALPEHNLLSLAFVETNGPNAMYTLAILHIDHERRTQLFARDLDIKDRDLSTAASLYLQRAILPGSSFPDTENPLRLAPVRPFKLDTPSETARQECLGGVLVLGGRKLVFVEAATVEEQKYERGKEKRQQKRKGSASAKTLSLAKEKEKEREAKKVKSRASVKWPWGEVIAWCSADDDGRRFFVGDIYGRLALLIITATPELILLPIGEIPAPTTLSYLSSQVLFVGSHTGDSQLLRIHTAPQGGTDNDTLSIPSSVPSVPPSALEGLNSTPGDDEDVDMNSVEDRRPGRGGKIVRLKGTYIEILDRFRNIAPILDAVMADTDQSGQPQLVTCSGGGNTGALNVLRTGADFQEAAILKDVPNITSIYPIRNRFEEDVDSHVLLSTLHESYVLRIDDRNNFSRIDSQATALITNEPTLALANIPKRIQRAGLPGAPPSSSYIDSSYVVQVTPKKITLVEYDIPLKTFNQIGSGWTPGVGLNQRPREIVGACLNASQFVVALNGGSIVLFNIGFNGQLNLVKTRELNKEISAISCTPFDPTKKFTSYIAVSFWESNEIQLLSLKDEQTYLTDFCKSPPLPALPRSVLLHNFGKGKKTRDSDYRPFIVAGLVDGTVACLSLQEGQIRPDYKLFALGATPVSLTVAEVDGKRAVFASGARAAVLYWERQRLRQSSVMLKDVTIGASLNTLHFPAHQIFATSTALHIGQIRGIDKMQIRTVALGHEQPRRIAYYPACNVYGVACTSTEPSRIAETSSQISSFNLIDGTTLTRLHQFVCGADEEISAVESLSSSGISTSAAFCVGTLRLQAHEHEPTLGRLLLFEADSIKLEIAAECETDGCVYAIATVNGMIAAAVNTSVDLYCVVSEDGSTRISRVARWNHNYLVTSLIAHNDRLIVGDAICSVSVLRVQNKSIQTIARDYMPLWPIAVEASRNSGVIGANVDCNLFTFSTQELGHERDKLELDGHYHIGEVVTKFLPGGLSAQDTHETSVFEPEHIFFTSSGRIGIIMHVNKDIQLNLTMLQTNMAAELVGPGDVQHTKWRTPSNARGSSDAEQAIGFLDGDFLEQFLTHPDQPKLIAGQVQAVELPLDKVEDLLEKLQSLH